MTTRPRPSISLPWHAAVAVTLAVTSTFACTSSDKPRAAPLSASETPVPVPTGKVLLRLSDTGPKTGQFTVTEALTMIAECEGPAAGRGPDIVQKSLKMDQTGAFPSTSRSVECGAVNNIPLADTAVGATIQVHVIGNGNAHWTLSVIGG